MDSTEVRRQWAERSGEYSPEYYAYYGPNETSEVVRRILERRIDKRGPVLELGCSSGRHLSHLLEHGFDDLAGIEVNDDAYDVMADTYPDLAAEGTFYLAAIEDVVDDFDDDQFSAVYSVQTLQHVHPDAEWIFDELVRVTGDLLVTVENEGDADGPGSEPGESTVSYVNGDFPLYHRDWGEIFAARGCREVDVGAELGVDVPDDLRETVRAFKPPSDGADRADR